MSKEQSDIVDRLRTHAAGGIPLADPLATLNDCVKAADEIEALRADLDKGAKLALSTVHAERAAILELIASYQADGHLYDGDYVLQTIAAAIRARGEWQ
jgi:hypothetical protein